jgi:hypothetical protein
MGEVHTTNYYRILGLTPSATEADIKVRYRLLCKTHHPDMGGSQESMAKLNEAYAVLSDADRRRRYDTEHRRAAQAQARAQAAQHSRPSAARPTPSTPPPSSQFAQAQHQATTVPQPPAKGTFGWFKFAWLLAAILVVVGLATQLPLAEVLGSSDNTPQTTNKPLNVTYQPDATPVVINSPTQTRQQPTVITQVKPSTSATDATTPTANASPAAPTQNTSQKSRACAYIQRHHWCTLNSDTTQACQDYCGNTQD